MTYLKHCDSLESSELDKITSLCELYTKVFTEANDYQKGVMVEIKNGTPSVDEVPFKAQSNE